MNPGHGILSEAKDHLENIERRKMILRFAQDDTPFRAFHFSASGKALDRSILRGLHVAPRVRVTEAPDPEDGSRSADGERISREELVRFFSVLSHDLKSPIFSIDGFSDLLLSDYTDKLDDDGRDFLQRIRSAAQNMKRVLDDMSQMVKLLSRPTVKRPTNLSEIVEEVLLRHNNAIDRLGIEVIMPDTMPVVNVDPEKFREAFSAVFLNAMTFTDREEGRTVKIECARENGAHQICIVDNGMGIDLRWAHQIFELGLKLDKSRGEGPGYGLYMARAIAEAHDGELTLETSLGEGSRFCFAIPD